MSVVLTSCRNIELLMFICSRSKFLLNMLARKFTQLIHIWKFIIDWIDLITRIRFWIINVYFVGRATEKAPMYFPKSSSSSSSQGFLIRSDFYVERSGSCRNPWLGKMAPMMLSKSWFVAESGHVRSQTWYIIFLDKYIFDIESFYINTY